MQASWARQRGLGLGTIALTLLSTTASLVAQSVQNEDAVILSAVPVRFELGTDVDLSGNTLVIGDGDEVGIFTPGVGTAQVFERSGLDWISQGELSPSNPTKAWGFGKAVAVDGNRIVVGAHEWLSGVGAAHVFHRIGTTWSEEALIQPSGGLSLDRFGRSVAISGSTIAVGAPGRDVAASPGKVFVFERSGFVWNLQQTLSAPGTPGGDLFGRGVALDQDLLVVGASHDAAAGTKAGLAFVYRRSGTMWSLEDTLIPSDPEAGALFGGAVALSGNTAVVGAQKAGALDEGAAYVFTESGGVWTEQQRLSPDAPVAADAFGRDVDIDGDRVLVGNVGGNGHGAAHAFVRTGGVWTGTSDFQPSHVGPGAKYARTVALDGLYAAVGWPDQDSDGVVAIHHLDSPWFDLGGENQSGLSQTVLKATGKLNAGSPVRFDIVNAAPNALMVAWVAFSSTPLDVLGGTVFANPPNRVLLFSSDAAGELSLPLLWPQFVPPGSDILLQFFVDDPSVVPYGLAVTDAMMATTP